MLEGLKKAGFHWHRRINSAMPASGQRTKPLAR